MLLFPPRSEARVWLGVASGRRSWALREDKEGLRALREDKEGLQLSPCGKPDFRVLLFDVLAGTPKS